MNSGQQMVGEMARITGNQPTEFFEGKYNADKMRMNGFLAQEVEQAAQSAGYPFSGLSKVKSVYELCSLSYESFVVLLVKAVQEQQQMIEELRKQNQALQEKVNKVEPTGASKIGSGN